MLNNHNNCTISESEITNKKIVKSKMKEWKIEIKVYCGRIVGGAEIKIGSALEKKNRNKSEDGKKKCNEKESRLKVL
jgi:hypothetical protein